MASGESYYLAAQVRELDRLAIEEHGIPGFTLMQRAGKAAFTALLAQWPGTTAIVCFCGSGNNGGDGYVIAALARQQGIAATVIAMGSTDKLQGDARQACDLASGHDVTILPFSAINENSLPVITNGMIIVDAMLGTGLGGEVRGHYARAVAMVNAMNCPVLAADIPSGLCSDTGKILGCAVKAELTVTFIGRKLGLILAEGPAMCGKVVFNNLAVPEDIYRNITPATQD